jgi:hypothetical protein
VVDLFQYPSISALSKHLQNGERPESPILTEVHHERASMRQEALRQRRQQRMKTNPEPIE